MKTVLTLLALIVAVHAQCNVPQYTQTFVPSCNPSTSRIKMPYYQNATQYYTCANNNPVLVTCPPSAPYFSYVLQQCSTCNDYIPAVPCSDLTIPNKPSCTNISATTTTPRPTSAPRTTTTKAPVPTPSLNSTTTSTLAPPTPAPNTPPGPGQNTPPGPGQSTPPGPGNVVVGPPSPATSNPNMVTPPTPMPTPPNIPDQPPFANNPPVTG